jgi:hypothetical protein
MTQNGLDVLEKELAEYVDLRRRLGSEDFRFVDALLGHRRQCMANLSDSEDEMWADRMRWLERLAERKGLVLADERPLRYMLDEIVERERKRRAEDIDRRKVEQETLA